MAQLRLIGSFIAIGLGLAGGVAAASATGVITGAGPTPLTAKACPSGQLSVGDVTYESDLPRVPTSDETPNPSEATNRQITVPSAAPVPENVQTVPDDATPVEKAQNWLHARPDLTAKGGSLAEAVPIDDAHKVVDITDSAGDRVAQLTFALHGANWRIENIRECAL